MAKLGKYELLEKLGEGRFGVVYKAKDNMGRIVALKVLKRQYALDSDAMQRFQREAQAAGSLFHPRIATILGFEEDEEVFLVMRYIDGITLDQQLKQGGALSWQESGQIIAQIAEGLDYAHGLGFIHRDIKPANILLSPRDGAVLTDFGLVKAAELSGMTSTGVMMGTPHYIAPEVWRGQAVGPATDTYALACVMFEMLTGKVLFEGESTPHIMTRHIDGPSFPERWPHGVPLRIEEVLRQALAQNPEERFASAGEFARAIQEGAGKTGGQEMNRYGLQEAVEAAIRLEEWGEANRLLAKLSRVAPGDPVVEVYRKKLKRELAGTDGAQQKVIRDQIKPGDQHNERRFEAAQAPQPVEPVTSAGVSKKGNPWWIWALLGLLAVIAFLLFVNGFPALFSPPYPTETITPLPPTHEIAYTSSNTPVSVPSLTTSASKTPEVAANTPSYTATRKQTNTVTLTPTRIPPTNTSIPTVVIQSVPDAPAGLVVQNLSYTKLDNGYCRFSIGLGWVDRANNEDNYYWKLRVCAAKCVVVDEGPLPKNTTSFSEDRSNDENTDYFEYAIGAQNKAGIAYEEINVFLPSECLPPN